jgi:hypothetical protein
MSWRPLLEGAEARRATDVAQRVGRRLTGEQPAGHAGVIAGGGVALLCAQLDRVFPEDGWDAAGHVQLAAVAQAVEQGAGGLGLFHGTTGVAFAAAALAAGRPRYERLLAEVDAVIVQGARASCTGLAGVEGVPAGAWDLISGLTGVGTYLLGRPDLRATLEAVLATLVSVSADGDGRPRWWTPHDALYEDMQREFPNGNVNCGLAHGVAGPLALWALAEHAGVAVAGQAEATARVGSWLAAQAREGPWGPMWPAAVATAADPPVPFARVRPGWCYGNAGVGRALALAGRSEEGAAAVRAGLRLQEDAAPLDEPILCHGTSGLAHVALRMAAESGDAEIAAAARRLCVELIDRADEVGDDPSLLTGASGIALVLLAAATPAEPTWDRALLLA